MVGNARSWLPELVERASKLKVSGGFEADTDVLVLHMLMLQFLFTSSIVVLLFLLLPSPG